MKENALKWLFFPKKNGKKSHFKAFFFLIDPMNSRKKMNFGREKQKNFHPTYREIIYI